MVQIGFVENHLLLLEFAEHCNKSLSYEEAVFMHISKMIRFLWNSIMGTVKKFPSPFKSSHFISFFFASIFLLVYFSMLQNDVNGISMELSCIKCINSLEMVGLANCHFPVINN